MKLFYFPSMAVILGMCISFCGCSKKDPSPASNTGTGPTTTTPTTPVSSAAITVNATDAFVANFKTDSIDLWFFVSDKTGKILDSQPITSSGTYVFNSVNADDSVTLTQLIKESNSGVDYFSATSYYVKRGMVLSCDNIQAGLNPLPAISGSVKVSLSNYNPVRDSPYRGITVSDGYSGEIASSNTAGPIAFPLRADTASLLVTAFSASDGPVYFWIHGVKSGDSIVQDFSKFKPYPHSLPLPEYSNFLYVDITGYYNRQNQSNEVFADGYDLTFFVDSSHDFPNPSINYIGGFDGYRMAIDNGSISYNKSGAINTSYTLPSPHITVLNNSFENFSTTSDSPFDYRYGSWSYSQPNVYGLTWKLYSGKGVVPKISVLPVNILTAYPKLDISQLKYVNANYIDRLDGVTLDEAMRASFAGSSAPSYEYYAYKDN